MSYNWQQADWPDFRYDLAEVQDDLLAFADQAGQVSGVLKGLPEGAETQAILDVMVAEAIKTSEIEGEYLNRSDVSSSIRNQLGLNATLEPVGDLASKGAGELMVEVRSHWSNPLDEGTLFAWHRTLLQGARSVAVGTWRTHEAAMQIVSNSMTKPKIDFEAPPSSQMPKQMAAFFRWFNSSRDRIKQGPVRSALAHLYFESVHPFEDGNGRIGRALSEKALSQGLGRPALLSLSRAIEADKKAYYAALESAQKSNEVTPWLLYFVGVVLQAQRQSEEQISFVLRKTKFFDRHRHALGERQLKVVKRMLDAAPGGFESGMNARKYVSLAKVSKATATRDLQKLVEQGVLQPLGGGRSRSYELSL